eukprot:TRINITY_DN14066_c0_g1_i1.p1 TRINITY_DN14066_c0_g1~~TRINITY_DN14066_c0_g1_i1.p1  ORF type:complete len:353 (-),score=84.52 TRINITY_DN14066_c0_g1_i1:79-1137(-)
MMVKHRPHREIVPMESDPQKQDCRECRILRDKFASLEPFVGACAKDAVLQLLDTNRKLAKLVQQLQCEPRSSETEAALALDPSLEANLTAICGPCDKVVQFSPRKMLEEAQSALAESLQSQNVRLKQRLEEKTQELRAVQLDLDGAKSSLIAETKLREEMSVEMERAQAVAIERLERSQEIEPVQEDTPRTEGDTPREGDEYLLLELEANYEELMEEKAKVLALQSAISTLAEEHERDTDTRVRRGEDTLWRMIAENEQRFSKEEETVRQLRIEVGELKAQIETQDAQLEEHVRMRVTSISSVSQSISRAVDVGPDPFGDPDVQDAQVETGKLGCLNIVSYTHLTLPTKRIV